MGFLSMTMGRRGALTGRRPSTGGVEPTPEDPTTYTAAVTVPADVHADYGAAYPITYAFAIPAGSSGLTAEYRTSEADAWTALTAAPAGRFDGITCARFDYAASRAFLSVPFGDTTDLFLRIRNGAEVVGDLIGIPRYYDDRRCTVLCTYDDWHTVRHAAFMDAAAAHAASQLWMSPGINAGGIDGSGPLSAAQWDDMQAAIDAGWLEPINHGYEHMSANNYGLGAKTAQEDADYEIGTGKTAILSNVTMPPQSRRGVLQWLHAWIRPYGHTSALARSTLASHDFLADRITDPVGVADFALWGSDGLYEQQNSTARVLLSSGSTEGETAAVAEVKTSFDNAHAARSVFVFYSYPHWWPSGWGVGSTAREWLEYIGAFDDIWSVGFGHAYQYRHVASKVRVVGTGNYEAGSRSLTNTANVVTVAKPEGTVEGDVLLAHHCYSGSGSTAVTTGWTLLEQSGTGWNQNAVWYRVAGASEPTEYQFSSTQSGDYHTVTISRYSGINATAPIDVFARVDPGVSGATITAPAVTASAAGVVVRIWASVAVTRIAPPTAGQGPALDRDRQFSGTASRPCWVIGEQHTPGGAVPAVPAELSTATTVRHGWTIVLRPASVAAPPPPAPVTVTDSFDRADENLEAAALWEKVSGQAAVVSNQAQIVTATAVYRTTVDAGSDDNYAQFEWTNRAGNSNLGIMCRMDPTALTFYLARLNNGNTLQLFKSVNNTLTQLGTSVTLPTWAAMTLRIEAQGSTIRVSVNGTEHINLTDTAVTTGQRAGFRDSGSTAAGTRFDNFEAGVL